MLRYSGRGGGRGVYAYVDGDVPTTWVRRPWRAESAERDGAKSDVLQDPVVDAGHKRVGCDDRNEQVVVIAKNVQLVDR